MVNIRPADSSDCALVWEWESDIDVREASFSTDVGTLDEFTSWFRQRLADPNFIILIATDELDTPIGRAYFELFPLRAVINVVVAPDHRGKGYATPLISAATDLAFEETSVRSVVGYIKVHTPAPIRAFQAAGYSQAGAAVIEDQDALVYEKLRPTA